MFIVFGMILLVGTVFASGTITNFSLTKDPANFVAGDTTRMNFSFDYPDDYENNPGNSLVLRVNLSSLNEEYPVWKDNFNMHGRINKYSLFDFVFENTYSLKCVEDSAEFRVERGLLYTKENINNGTFYCYDPNNYIDMLELGRRDKGYLNISSDPALYPGDYNITVELMEMEPDNKGPEIELVSSFDNTIFSENDNVIPIKINVTDMYNIDEETVRYKITEAGADAYGKGSMDYYESGWIDLDYSEESGLYEGNFDMQEHGLDESGEYWIYAEAEDVLGNRGKL